MSKDPVLKNFADRLMKLETEFQALKDELAAYISSTDVKETAVNPVVAKPSQAKAQSGTFPYPVGAVVKIAFPELFKRKLVNAGDVAYLLSDDATRDFKTRGYPILRVYTTDNDPGLYACNHRRFYKMKPLELGTKKYHLSSQFYPESRQAVLAWIFAHGLKKKELLSLMAT